VFCKVGNFSRDKRIPGVYSPWLPNFLLKPNLWIHGRELAWCLNSST